jgi:hypothetical protein
MRLNSGLCVRNNGEGQSRMSDFENKEVFEVLLVNLMRNYYIAIQRNSVFVA